MALLSRTAVAAALLVLGTGARADLASENDLKSAFVYNFIVLTTWPAETPAVLRFCVAGAPSGATRFQVLAGKAAHERTLAVEVVASPERTGECHILYLPPGEASRQSSWLAGVGTRAILTISDQGASPDAIVNLRKAGERIVFDVNTRAAAVARIGLSSQLVKLAATRQ